MMKRFIKSLGLVLCLIVLIGMSGTTASKAKSKNTIKVTLTVGKTYQLKVTGTKKKIKWHTSNKKVATVSSKGKIKAKKAGKAKIYAKIGKKKLICYLTVKSKKTKKSKNSKANTSTTKKPANTNTTVQPSVTQTPANTVAPIAPVSPTGVPGVTEKPSATVQPDATPISTPQYTDGPQLKQTYHANLSFLTDDWTFARKDEKGYIANTTNGFYCEDSLGNYIANNRYVVQNEEVTIDHPDRYSFKISGLNNMLQNAKDFKTLYIDTDIGLNKNIKCRNLELYIDDKLVKYVEDVENIPAESYYIQIKNIWNPSAIYSSSEKIPIPKNSIEIRCYLDPGQDTGVSYENMIANYSNLKKYIENYDDLKNYVGYEFIGEGIAYEDDQYLYTISTHIDQEDGGWYFMQYDKETKQCKVDLRLASSFFYADVYIKSEDNFWSSSISNIMNITTSNPFGYAENKLSTSSSINTEINQEFQRSLKGWNQLLNERLHMSLKDFGFVSYE